MRILLLGFRWGLLITPALMMMATLVISALSVHNHDDHDLSAMDSAGNPNPTGVATVSRRTRAPKLSDIDTETAGNPSKRQIYYAGVA